MRIDVPNASPLAPEVPPATASTGCHHDLDTPLRVSLGRVVVEGLGPVSPGSLREGFREAWLKQPARLKQWSADPPAISESLRSPIDLHGPASADGRELGRRVAEAILRRTSPTKAPASAT